MMINIIAVLKNRTIH